MSACLCLYGCLFPALYCALQVIPWPTLFTPATTTTTLTHFSCDERLTGQLLGLLLAHAPALKHLGVWCVDLGTDEYRQRVWGVETLTMLGSLDSRNDLQHLPTARSLSINVPRVWLDITSAQVRSILSSSTSHSMCCAASVCVCVRVCLGTAMLPVHVRVPRYVSPRCLAQLTLVLGLINNMCRACVCMHTPHAGYERAHVRAFARVVLQSKGTAAGGARLGLPCR